LALMFSSSDRGDDHERQKLSFQQSTQSVQQALTGYAETTAAGNLIQREPQGVGHVKHHYENSCDNLDRAREASP